MWFWLLLAMLPTAAIAGISAVVVPPTYAGPCDTISGCAAAYSMTRAMSAAYAGSLFQLNNGTTTLNIGQTAYRYADLSGIPAFCAGHNCVVSKIYDQIHSADLVPVTGHVGNSPAGCVSGNDCAAPFWLDPTTGLPAAVTVYPTEYDVNAPSVNAGANPTSVWFYGRNDQYPAQFGVGHAPASANTNGSNFIASVVFTDFPFDGVSPWTFGYLKCSSVTEECVGIDEETSVDPYTVSVAPGGIGANYATSTQEDIKVLATWDGVTNIKIYTNSSTATFSGSPPASVQFDSSALVPGKHVKIGCGGDCTHSQIIFREGLIANATLASSDYTALSNNVSVFYATHTTAATCHGGADLEYYTGVKSLGGADWNTYQPGPSSSFLSYSLAQTRASYFGYVADLNNGTTTQSFTSALAAGSAGCGLDPAAATFCNPSCTVVKLYNQGTWSSTNVGNAHDTTLDLVFAGGQRPAVTFNSLNSLPTMHFTGGQYGCMTQSATAGAFFGHSAVARRTSGTTASTVLSMGGTTPISWIGFDGSGQAGFFGNNTTIDEAATESHWHSIMYENGTGSPYVDGSAGAGNVGSAHENVSTAAICIGARSDGSQALTGDIAEVDFFSINSHAAVEYTSRGTLLNTTMQSVWGTLPN